MKISLRYEAYPGKIITEYHSFPVDSNENRDKIMAILRGIAKYPTARAEVSFESPIQN